MYNTIAQERLDQAAETIELAALHDHTTPEEIRRRLEEVIAIGLSNPDPAVREQWSHCPCRGQVPTPEEFLLWVAQRAKEGTIYFSD